MLPYVFSGLLVAVFMVQPQEASAQDAATPTSIYGRLTYSFRTGVVLSQDDDQFSKLSPYIDFTGDTTLRSQRSELISAFLSKEYLAEARARQQAASLTLEDRDANVKERQEAVEAGEKDLAAAIALRESAALALAQAKEDTDAAAIEEATKDDMEASEELTRFEKALETVKSALTEAIQRRNLAARDASIASTHLTELESIRDAHESCDQGILACRDTAWSRLSGELDRLAGARELEAEASVKEFSLSNLNADRITDENERKAVEGSIEAIRTEYRSRRMALAERMFAIQMQRTNFDPGNLHTRISLQLGSIPTIETASDGDFVTSKKSFIGSAGIDWRAIRMEWYRGRTLAFGPSVMWGLQTAEPAENQGNLDSVNYLWGAGLRMSEGSTETLSDLNPRHGRHLAVYYGGYEQFGDSERLTVEGVLQPDGSGPFVGLQGIVGKGKDDVRLFAGVNLELSTLADLVTANLPIKAAAEK